MYTANHSKIFDLYFTEKSICFPVFLWYFETTDTFGVAKSAG